MGKYKNLFRALFTILFVFAANSTLFISRISVILPFAILSFVVSNLLPGFIDFSIKNIRLKICHHGTECLHIFLFSIVLSFLYHLLYLCLWFQNWKGYVLSMVLCILAHMVLFFQGIICVYFTSVQLGIKIRVLGILCGAIPIAHLLVLDKIIKITEKEVQFETQKEIVNQNRRALQICNTKYPILLVHGVFFRDYKKLNYWGRIPGQLEKNGATIFYGQHQSALSVKDSAIELAERIKSIVRENGCEKVNIIAHSKGGLDCKYAIDKLGIATYVASLTTINSPHRGCGFADYLLEKIPENMQKKVAGTYNKAAKKLGDSQPDFMKAVNDLTEKSCKKRESEYELCPDIYCQSVGSILKKATHGKFPLNFSYPLVKYFDGANDGLVSVTSFSFGEKFELLEANGKRGISHADMIDLNRENIEGFDVREFYVQLVSKLKQKGL